VLTYLRMEPKSTPAAVVIAQDDQTDIHVQAPQQSERRHVDIRLWRRGPEGSAPAGTGLTLYAADLDALHEAIAQLLEASRGGQQAVRIVHDVDEEKRVRAEIEPFGTHFVARLGFWQRVRDTWRPADDGLVVAAERLRAIQVALDRFQAWIHSEHSKSSVGADLPVREALLRWPSSGADWISLEADRISFHPRGVRITCSIMEQEARHWVSVRQWRREESLWLPEPTQLALTVIDLDLVIPCLRRIADSLTEGSNPVPEEVACQDGSTLRIEIVTGQTPAIVHVNQRLPEREDRVFSFESRLRVPGDDLPRFGRALAESWSLLLGWLSDEERFELQTKEFRERDAHNLPGESDKHIGGERTEIEARPVTHDDSNDSALEDTHEIAILSGTVPEDGEEVLVSTAGPDLVFPFGSESETPGVVITAGNALRVSVEGFANPRQVELPIDLAPKVISGLEDLNVQRRKHPRVDPVLLCDRPNCAVYGRVGTAMRPDCVEVRVWTGPTTSDSISFETVYLDDLLEGMRQSVVSSQKLSSPSSRQLSSTAPPPSHMVQPSAPARMRTIAPRRPLTVPGPIVSEGDEHGPVTPISIDAGEIHLGDQRVSLRLHGYRDHPSLALEWDANYFEIPVEELGDLLTDLRALYYDALRGRRGRTLSVGQYPIVTISVRSREAQLFIRFQQDIDGDITALTFPASDVPGLLDAAQIALEMSLESGRAHQLTV
jgi:hypothetical protein